MWVIGAGFDFESVACTKRYVERVGTRTCEGIFVCNTWEVKTCNSGRGGYG